MVISASMLFALPSLTYGANKFYSFIGKNLEGYYSQCGQDKYLHENLFKNKKNGIFIK
ncbi:MAG: hypothetical protein K940chlam5_00589 [Candidatus Anoxychlamydiales bacterium]|nr:hypothetical protein [Candidatus Anoxychlamydiales bacterium]